MPNTKPDLFFDEDGVCDACSSAEMKSNEIDWDARRKEFEETIEKYRNNSESNYDCIIPVSGGKDSHYQTYMAKMVYGLNPLLVHFEPTRRNSLGRKNLENIKKAFGVDMVVVEKNPVVYKKMNIEGFRRVGDHDWPNHIGIFTSPVRAAVQQNIPFILWGENSQLEYGGPKVARMKNVLDRRWLEEFGGLLGFRVEDMIGINGVTKGDLIPYMYPSDEELKRVGVTGLFLGYYFKWDARKQVEIVRRHGFSIKEDGPVGGTYTNYENLDDNLVAIHDYMKFVKFGFGRTTDHACLDIRNGYLGRKEAVELIKKYDGKLPHKAVKEFLDFFEMSEEEFSRIVDSFTNKALFKTNNKGDLVRDSEGNLVKRYQDYGSGLPLSIRKNMPAEAVQQ